MRIAFVPFYFAPDMSAISQLFTPLVYELGSMSNHSFTVFTSRSRYIRTQAGQKAESANGVCIERVPTLNLGKQNILTRLLDYAAYYVYVSARLLLSRDFDMIVSLTQPPMMPALLGLLLTLRPKLRFIYHVEDLYPEILFDSGFIRRPWLVRKLRRMNEIAFRRAQAIITIGSYMSRYLQLSYGVSERKISVVHNWPNTRPVSQQPKRSKEIRLVYSGNLGLAHDLSLLRPLIDQLARFPRPVHISFYGGGRRKREVQTLLNELPEGVSVTFHGYAPANQVASNLASADVLMLAQSAETVFDIIPSKFYSYLFAGRPMLFFGPIASDIGQTILNAGIGWVLRSGDQVPAVAKAIASSFGNARFSEQIRRRTTDLATERFSMNAAAGKIMSTIEESAHGR